eukprot:gene2629-8593_t
MRAVATALVAFGCCADAGWSKFRKTICASKHALLGEDMIARDGETLSDGSTEYEFTLGDCQYAAIKNVDEKCATPTTISYDNTPPHFCFCSTESDSAKDAHGKSVGCPEKETSNEFDTFAFTPPPMI